MKTYPLLENAPAHDSHEFIKYLRENNVVVWENPSWIVIENCKYHKPEAPWYTAFFRGGKDEDPTKHLDWLLTGQFSEWEWLKKAKSKQTVERFHIHLIKK